MKRCAHPNETAEAPYREKRAPAGGAEGRTAEYPNRLPPVVKWPGGKEKELKYIIPNAPRSGRYFDPFVGGGAVFMGVTAEEYYINDLSAELIGLYRCIAGSDEGFFLYAEEIDRSWESAAAFAGSSPALAETYSRYRRRLIGAEELRASIRAFCADSGEIIRAIPGGALRTLPCVLPEELEASLFRKMTRMREIESAGHELTEKDLLGNIETAVKSALYANYRSLYNSPAVRAGDRSLHCALFLFLRNYAYSGMFRYSAKGGFNVPYGGMAYNGKLMAKKLGYYRSAPLLRRFSRTRIYNLDFEDFLRAAKPAGSDFVFLDPPYDSKFSTYAGNDFTRKDHERLAAYLTGECKARWMLVIKNTGFIAGLYKGKAARVRAFDKKYLVSFMNRNDKNATHLMITNY